MNWIRKSLTSTFIRADIKMNDTKNPDIHSFFTVLTWFIVPFVPYFLVLALQHFLFTLFFVSKPFFFFYIIHLSSKTSAVH